MPDPWLRDAIAAINADFTRSADTHLLPVLLPALPGIRLYIKDESTHLTGSLKHRLARSLFLYALCNGWIRRGTPVIEASSGSTAISEAYYARLLGLRFIAVVARTTSPEKLRRIEQYGGECVFVDDPRQDRARARALAAELGGHFMDQFTFAERATDWRGNNNIAESIFKQLADEPESCPRWIICGAGTGGTAATLGRYVRYRSYATEVCVVDPEHSVYHRFFETRDPALALSGGSGVEGIGRPQVEPSFLPEIIDRMIAVPNAASYAAIRVLEEVIGRRYGGSTGTNFYGACLLISEMLRRGEHGALVMIGCDSGDLYRDSYYSDRWLAEQNVEIGPFLRQMRGLVREGRWEA
ncbi:MAG: PLP-dependent cysteine synthase family protein [Roseiflexaceae bacterium]